MPGMLIPADLDRMIPEGADPYEWAMVNLLASQGAIVMKDGKMFRIPTLVPAVKADGSCINLINGRCMIHEISPYGCAFFSCQDGDDELHLIKVSHALEPIQKAWHERGLYAQIWVHLAYYNKTQIAPEHLKAKIINYLKHETTRTLARMD